MKDRFWMNCACVSIIVPVYCVEQYLQRCLDSIMCQTYENLQIVLIDDGSPDRCGEICDANAITDSRIEVIHQANAGLSAARNAGLKVAIGDYLLFVDSDDYIAPVMVEELLATLKKNNAEIATCGYCTVSAGKKEEFLPRIGPVLSGDEYLVALFENVVVHNFIWNKLYVRNLFSNIWFPAGKNYEDILVTYQVIERTARIAVCYECLYYYTQRRDSIVGKRGYADELTCCENYILRYDDINKRRPEFSPTLLRAFFLQNIKHLALIATFCSINTRRKYDDRAGRIRQFLSENEGIIRELLSPRDQNMLRLVLKNDFLHDAIFAFCCIFERIVLL